MSNCACGDWIQSLPIPEKILIFKCSVCGTEYTLFPNGQIQFEQIEQTNVLVGTIRSTR